LVSDIFGDADEGGANLDPAVVILEELQNAGDRLATDGGVD
jgi:hypothetical protein